MEESINFVEQKYVHKTLPENNHIYNMRRALPREISIDDYEIKILPAITPAEADFLSNYYVVRETLTGKAYILKSVPQKIPKERAESLLHSAEVSSDDLEFLNSMYKLNEKEGKYILVNPNITEADEVRILEAIGMKTLEERAKELGVDRFYISDYEKYEIAKILEPIDGLQKKDIIFSNLFVDQKHYYFFEHPQEHLPGMFITEAGRQFVIAVCHIYGNVPLDAVFMLTQMDCRFLNYVELNFPIKLRSKPVEVKTNKQGQWSYYKGTVTFYQKNKEVAAIEYETSIVNKALFSRLRSDKDQYDQLPRFRPLPGFENNMSVRDGTNRYLCSIIDVSLSGFLLKFDTEDFLFKTKQPEDLELEFFMFFPKVGFIHGKCKMVWSLADADDKYVAGFHIVKIDKLDMNNLKESIKFYFKVREDREIV